MGKSRRLGSKTCPSFENWFKNKGFPCKGDQSRTMASGSPCWWPLLPGLGWVLGYRPAAHGPSPPGLRASEEPHWDPQNKSNRSISSPRRRVPGGVARVGRGLGGGGDSGENSPREAGEGTPGKGAALAEAKQRVAAGDMGSSRRRKSGISSCVTPGLGGADKILLNSRQS